MKEGRRQTRERECVFCIHGVRVRGGGGGGGGGGVLRISETMDSYKKWVKKNKAWLPAITGLLEVCKHGERERETERERIDETVMSDVNERRG